MPTGNYYFLLLWVEHQCGKVEFGVRLPGKDGIDSTGLTSYNLRNSRRETSLFLILIEFCYNSKLLCGLTWVIAHPRDNLCDRTDGIPWVFRIGSSSHCGVGWREIQFKRTWIKGRWHIVPRGKLKCHFLEKGERLPDR